MPVWIASEERMLTQARLAELLDYDPTTGIFTWRVSIGGVIAGAHAGHRQKGTGYWLVQVDGFERRASQFAWLYMTGEWPNDKVDHKNRIRSDDRWENLRLASHAQQTQNRGINRNNTSGHKGISWRPRRGYLRDGRWCAQISADGQRHYLGEFKHLEDAIAVRDEAVRRLHGEFAGRLASEKRMTFPPNWKAHVVRNCTPR